MRLCGVEDSDSATKVQAAIEMPPRPVRGPTRKASQALPQTQRMQHLLDSSVLFATSAPHLAAALGRAALQVQTAPLCAHAHRTCTPHVPPPSSPPNHTL